jgi:hypothetical protein
MIPWTPQPSAALVTDLPLLLAAPEVQALVFRLGHVARGGRVPFPGREPVGAVVALCGGARWAAGALADAVDAGFVVIEEGEIVLTWEWPTLAAAAGPTLTPAAPARVSSVPPAARERVAGDRAAERRVRALWSRYGLTTAEARVAWIDSPAGERALAREGRDRGWAVELTQRVSTDPKGRFGCPPARTTADNSATDNRDGQPRTTETDNPTDNPTDNRSPSPAPPPSEKNEKEAQKARAGGPTTERTTPRTTATDNRSGEGGGQPAPTTTDNSGSPRLPTVERPGAIGAGEVFMELRGTGALRLTTSGAHEVELERILAGVSPAWARESVRRLAAHIREGHLRDGWKPALSHLRGKDGSWTTLLSLYDEAQGCERCRPARPPPQRTAPATGDEPRARPVFTEETAKKFECFTGARREAT